MKHILRSVFFVILAGVVLAGCEMAAGDATKTLIVNNRSSFTIKDIKWSDETFTGGNETTLAPDSAVTSIVSSIKAEDSKGYIFFNSTGDVAFRTQAVVSFADSDTTFTFTDNTVIVELYFTANTGTLVRILSIPTGIDLIAGNGRLTVSWAAVEGASSYNVYYGTSMTPPETPAQTNITGTSTTIIGLTNEQTYYVWVQSVNVDFVSELSSMRSAATPTVYMANTTGTFKQAIDRINVDIAGSYAIVVTGSFFSDVVTFSTNADKTISIEGDSTNRSIYNDGNNALFTVPGGITLVLDNNLTLNGNNKVSPAVSVEAGGILAMNSGSTITGARHGGVYIGGGTLNMMGGAISGNSIYPVLGALISGCFGAGVCIDDGGVFTMSGGAISANSVYSNISDPGITAYCYGGGVLVFNGLFNMTGGTISGNSAADSGHGVYGKGGGVYVGNLNQGGSRSFTMSGGAISGNSSSRQGGGVFIESGSFIMTGGTISGNSAGAGGGVFLIGGSFTMADGMISGNSAEDGGGGVCIPYSGSFSKTGGAIDAANSAPIGKVAYVSEYQKRETAAGPSDNLNSDISGSAGGWE
jgi:hypothetical protein